MTTKNEAGLSEAIEDLKDSLRGELDSYTSFGFIRGEARFASTPRSRDAARAQRAEEVAKIRSFIRAIRILRAAESEGAGERGE